MQIKKKLNSINIYEKIQKIVLIINEELKYCKPIKYLFVKFYFFIIFLLKQGLKNDANLKND